MEDAGVRFRRVVDASPMGMHMYRLEEDGRLFFDGANPAADRLLGVDNSQFVGQTIEEAFPSLVDTEIPDRYRRAAAEGIPWRTNHVTYADDKVQGAFEVYAFQTSPGQMAAMFLEITDRLRADQVIRDSEELFRNYFELGRIGMAIVSPDERWSHVNDQLCAILGHSHEALSRSTWSDLTHADDRKKENRLFGRVLAGEIDGYSREKRFIRADRSTVHTRVFVSCIRGDDGEVKNILVHVEDITEQRSLEEQLRQAQKMEAIGRLAGGVAHDFNNILTGILGYAELMLTAPLQDETLRSGIEEILRASERGAALTQQLLAFSRKQIISPRRIDLNEVISHSEKLLGRIIGEDVELVFRPKGGLWTIEADPGQIDQILVNLATNSRDAMRSGGKITIEAENVHVDQLYCRNNPECRPGEYVVLAVSDTGEGMDPEIQPLIFEPFFSTKADDQGTGLGLSTVYGIVRQSGGFIQVYSESRVGTTFKIGFPRVGGKPAEPLESESESVPEGSETVLVVEDEQMVRGLACRVLGMHGYNVLEAGGAEEAVTRTEAFPGEIHLLLADVVMPGTNGIDLYQSLLQSRPELKALFMSGYTDTVIAQHGVLRGDMQFLPKPFTVRSLTRKVRETLDD